MSTKKIRTGRKPFEHFFEAQDPPKSWNIRVHPSAMREARKEVLVDDAARNHAIGLLWELASEMNPRMSSTLDIDKVQTFWELRDWNGPLYPVNLRIYYTVMDSCKEIRVLMVDDKRYDGPTDPSIVDTIKWRMANWP